MCTVLLLPGLNPITVNRFIKIDKTNIFYNSKRHFIFLYWQKEYPEKLMIELFHFHVLTTVVITVVETDQWLFLTDSANFASNTV